MKFSKLTFALTATLSSFTAAAVSLAPNGRGEALIFPYYTVEGGINTTLSLTNHTDRAKALVVRFRESANSRPVLSFNLYLGKRDVWTAAVFTLGDEQPAALLTNDPSCTVPGIRSSVAATLPTLPSGQRYVPFRNFGYAGSSADGGNQQLSRTRSGFIEIIEMGTLVADSNSEQSASASNGSGCGALEAAWATGGYWQADNNTDMSPPSGGLSGSLSLIDVSDGSLTSLRATALQQFSSIVQHAAPGSNDVGLNSAVSDAAAGTVQSVVLGPNGAKVSNWPRARAFEAVSAALSQASIGNDFLVDSALGAHTEWVVTFPTRGYHTDPALVSAAVAPFTQLFRGGSVVPTATCEEVGVAIYNRERGLATSTPPAGGSAGKARLCGGAQVISFAPTSTGLTTLLGSRDGLRLNPDNFSDGQAELDFSAFKSSPAIGGEAWRGLPAIGFALNRFANTAARPGTLALYSGAVPHSGVSSCEGSGCP